MGLVVCPKHGNGFMFVCPHVSTAVHTGSQCRGIRLLVYIDADIEDIEDIELACWFCPQCVADHHLPPNGTVLSDPVGYMNTTSHLYRPMCPGCFAEWQANAC